MRSIIAVALAICLASPAFAQLGDGRWEPVPMTASALQGSIAAHCRPSTPACHQEMTDSWRALTVVWKRPDLDQRWRAALTGALLGASDKQPTDWRIALAAYTIRLRKITS